MKHISWVASGCLLALLLVSASAADAEILHKTMRVANTVVSYAVVLPDHYDSHKAYPAILGFGGGPQNERTVDRLMADSFAPEAQRRGYIVVVPAAPNDELFFEGGERIFPAFIEQILSDYHIQDGKFHAAGPSNGGISAFYIASLYPRYFSSITAFPGYLPDPTPVRVAAISKMCIHMFVGQYDELGFDRPMQQEATAFRADGLSLTYQVEPGQPHRMATLAGTGAARLFDQLEQDKHGCQH